MILGIIITDIIISKEVFKLDLELGLISVGNNLYYSLSYVALILISIHIGLHWVSIMGFFKRIFNLKTFNKARTIVLRIITLLIVIAGIRGSF